MALLDFLKKKKESAAAKAKTDKIEKVKKQPEKKVESVLVAKKAKKIQEASVTEQTAPTNNKKRTNNFSYNIVKEPHISEKANTLSESNKYTFKVYSNSNKPEIKKSVEGIYNVDVLGVNIIKAPHKKRRLGKTQGFKKAFTKAVVTIKEGQKIEII